MFAQQYGFDGARGGGAHMWREVWDDTVSHIYEHTLSKSYSQFILESVLIRYCFAVRADREGGAAFREVAQAGPVRGAQTDEKVHLGVSNTVGMLLVVVTSLIRARPLLSQRAISYFSWATVWKTSWEVKTFSDDFSRDSMEDA